MEGIGETGIVGTRGSCSGDVVEGSGPFALVDSKAGCLAAAIVSDRQTGANDSEGLCSVTNVVSNVNASFADYGSSRNDRIEGSGASLYQNRKRSRGGTLMGSNADGSGSSSSKRQHVSPDHDNEHLTTPVNNPMSASDLLPNMGISSYTHASSQNNPVEEPGASLYWSRKRTKGIMPMGGNADTSGSSSSTRRRLSPDCHNLNTPTPNNTPMSAVNSSSTTDMSGSSSSTRRCLSTDRHNLNIPTLNNSHMPAVSSSSTAGAAGSSPSTRRRLSVDHHNLNTSTLNNSPKPTVNSFSTPIHNSGARKDRTGPPLEYKYIGKCEYSCEHCGARF
ncbi:hypothetical protein Tco_1567903, partial [Tanacetum coccineum]